MLLLTHGVRFAQPRHKRRVDVGQCLESKGMQVVSWRERFDLSEPRVLEPAREDDVAVEPALTWRDLSERHADLECDAGLFRENDDGSERTNGCDNEIIDLAHDRVAPDEVVLEVVQPAGMRLVPIRERAVALRATPK